MIKQFVVKPKHRGAGATAGSDLGLAVWSMVGRRLQRRRAELGYGADHVAQSAAVPAETYESYENGAPIPAAVLARVADLLGVPLVWFFQEADEDEDEDEADNAEESAEPVVYRVATVEHRIVALVESFRQLDFEGQQHLLAISQALTRTNARS